MTEPTKFPAHGDVGAGMPLVFLHGWSVDRSFFAPQLVLADKGFRIVTPDLAGHGDRPLGTTPPTIAGLADALASRLADLALPPAVLVGWSMGATVALDLIARHGCHGVAGLVIVDMTPKVPNGPDWPYGLSSGQNLADATKAAERMERDWLTYAPKIARAMFAPGRPDDDPLILRATECIAARDPQVMASLWRSLVNADHRETVKGLPVPVLALAGAESQLYRPDVAGWIAAHAPVGRSAMIAGAGHAPQVECSAAFNADVAAFASDCAGRPISRRPKV